jgi:hypothetical protein
MSTQYTQAPSGAHARVHHVFCEPPASITRLVEDLFSSKFRETASPAKYITADEVPPDKLRVLNAFAALVANKAICNIVAIYECHSCYEGDSPGDLVDTDSGTQCWKC